MSHVDFEQVLFSHPTPRTLKWDDFLEFWRSVADKAEQESGDRLAVDMNGHREVFRRQHDGTVSIEDVERARHLLQAKADPKGTGELLVVVIDETEAGLYNFDLDKQNVVDSEVKVRNHDTQTQHIRRHERYEGKDPKAQLEGYFEDVVAKLNGLNTDDLQGLIVLGHGKGESAIYESFTEFLGSKNSKLHDKLTGTGKVDIDEATPAVIEKAALEVFHNAK